MNTTELIQEISVKDVDVEKFVLLALGDDHIRDEIVRQMLTHPHIMVYYHCFYVIKRASHERPELFYHYWHDIASLLHHKNSYHRDFALTIIANLTRVDHENRFLAIFDDYFAHLNDAKFMTAQCCVQSSVNILRSKPELRDRIIALLLDVDHQCAYPEKQRALLKCDVLEVLDDVYNTVSDNERVHAFVKAGINSISPKTRRKAKELVGKYGL